MAFEIDKPAVDTWWCNYTDTDNYSYGFTKPDLCSTGPWDNLETFTTKVGLTDWMDANGYAYDTTLIPDE